MKLNPIIEFEHITRWTAKIVGKEICVKKLTRSLSRHLNKRHPVIVRLQYSKELDQNDFTIGAFYEPNYDEVGRKPLIIVFIVNCNKTVEIVNVERLSIELLEALIHEYQHLHQYRSRGFILNKSYSSSHSNPNIRADQEYLGSPDEIDAYAANIAARHFVLRDDLARKQSHDLGNYYYAFGPHHPVIKKLLKKVVKNLYILQNQNTLHT